MFAKIKKKLRKRDGMSLGETMLCVLILSLVTLTLASGLQLATNHYNKSVALSEGKVLCSTLKSVITNELGNTNAVILGDKVTGDTYVLDRFFSRTYAIKKEYSSFYSVRIDQDRNITKSGDGFGELLLGTKNDDNMIVGNLLVSSAAYSSYRLSAHVDVTYNTDLKLFHVILAIRNPYGISLEDEFDVIPLNTVELISP